MVRPSISRAWSTACAHRPHPVRIALAVYEAVDHALQALARGLAEIRSPVGECEPAPTSERAQVAIASAADSLALSHTALHSGAGHDAQSLAAITDAGMIFIPSRDGISHSPLEFSE